MPLPVRRILVVVIVVVLLLTAGGWWFGRASDAPAPVISAGDTATDTPTAMATDAEGDAEDSPELPQTTAPAIVPESASATAPTASAPLPAHDAPVAEVFDDLLERARRGDTRAACRLGSDLQRCLGHTRARYSSEQMEQRTVTESDPVRRERMIDYMASMEERRSQAELACRGLSDAQLDMAFALQMQAAQADPGLRLWAALNPALDHQFFVGELDRWQQYRQVALPWLEEAAANGDISAVIALARVHGDSRRPGPMNPPLRLLDDARFVTYADLMERYGASFPVVTQAAQAARARLDPETLAAAERRAGELHRPDVTLPDAPDRIGPAMRRSFNQVPEAEDCE